MGAAFAASAARYDDRTAIVDPDGTVTYRELDARSDALARAFAAFGVRTGDTVGVMCRNHRHFFEVTAALGKLGVNALYLNTGFSPPQLHDVMQRERARRLVYDDEFAAAARGLDAVPVSRLDDLIAHHRDGPRPARPAHEGRTIILTSGTTGAPKGAAREQSAEAAPAIALLERIPYHARETMVVAAPCFHSWGFANALVGLLLGNTIVLDPHFEPERVLASIERHRAQVLAAVPVMLLRILELPAATIHKYDTSSLRLVPLSGSSLPGDLATRFMDTFGDVVYNLYGSTEVGYVAIASPADLRAAPSTAGRPPRGADVRLLDERDRPVPTGTTGRIFVRSGLLFDGYTDGGSKHVADGFMQTGDTGHFDAGGRLFVDGRDDDMIVSGGENVFPAEVEDVIAQHPDVVEAAVVGVPDEEFGQRLKAFVVRRDGAPVDGDGIRAHVRRTLARYKVPRDVEFVHELPRNATGKVVRRHLG
jgi:acyl-CoA synthetase (AMP-forming)/AMP-acid ligase II